MESFHQGDLRDLQYAKSLLEHPGLAAKLTNLLGTPLEKSLQLLPDNLVEIVISSSEKILLWSVNSAIGTMNSSKVTNSSEGFHKLVVASSGAVGGFWGLPALLAELPVSTTIMMRSIADIARSEGHNISDPFVKMACVEVFALGGPGKSDDAAETGYFAVRTLLANTVNDAVKHLAAKGMSEKGTPILLKLISQVSARFGVQVSEKIAAQFLPVIGAAGGAAINTVFINHYQAMARGHFIVLRLEKKYGAAIVRNVYNEIKMEKG